LIIFENYFQTLFPCKTAPMLKAIIITVVLLNASLIDIIAVPTEKTFSFLQRFLRSKFFFSSFGSFVFLKFLMNLIVFFEHKIKETRCLRIMNRLVVGVNVSIRICVGIVVVVSSRLLIINIMIAWRCAWSWSFDICTAISDWNFPADREGIPWNGNGIFRKGIHVFIDLRNWVIAS